MVVLEVHLKKLGDQSPPSLSLSALASLCICGGGAADSAVGERYTYTVVCINMGFLLDPVINPRRACARVTVVVLSVCVSVCLSVCSRSSCFSVRWNQQTTVLTGFS